jgi:hypothetical protein
VRLTNDKGASQNYRLLDKMTGPCASNTPYVYFLIIFLIRKEYRQGGGVGNIDTSNYTDLGNKNYMLTD